MNYFIGDGELEIPEKNIYTAVEIATLMPLRGRVPFENFFSSNDWTQVFFPNKYRAIQTVRNCRSNWFKKMIEKILDNKIGDAVDNRLMKWTERSWRKKTLGNKKNSKGMLMDMHVGKHVSRPNPVIFQKKFIQRYEFALTDIFRRYDFTYAIKNKL
jgi:hypothetical protein